MFVIERESRLGATIVMTVASWSVLRRTLVTLKGGEEVAMVIDVAMRSAPAWGPFRVRLSIPQLNLLESAYARIC